MDRQVGVMEKIEAHRHGHLHRAFSVFLINEKNEMLLQQRAFSKYHSPGLWSNACCSHPRPGETNEDAAARRLNEEMGIVCDLTKIHSFIYQVDLKNGLFEHEYDHVFRGVFSGTPEINLEEVADWKFVSLEELQRDVAKHPLSYTHWFRLLSEADIFEKLVNRS